MTELMPDSNDKAAESKDNHKIPTLICGFHIYSLIVTVALDCVWTVLDVFLPLCIVLAIICFVIVFFIQWYFAHEKVASSIIKAAIMGIIAGVPLPVASIVFSIAVCIIQYAKDKDINSLLDIIKILGTLTNKGKK